MRWAFSLRRYEIRKFKNRSIRMEVRRSFRKWRFFLQTQLSIRVNNFFVNFFVIFDSLLHYSYLNIIIIIMENLILFDDRRYTYSLIILNLHLLLYHIEIQKNAWKKCSKNRTKLKYSKYKKQIGNWLIWICFRHTYTLIIYLFFIFY